MGLIDIGNIGKGVINQIIHHPESLLEGAGAVATEG